MGGTAGIGIHRRCSEDAAPTMVTIAPLSGTAGAPYLLMNTIILHPLPGEG